MTTELVSPETSAIAPLGEELRESFDALIDAVADGVRRPSALARELEVNRVIVSRLLNALKRDDPLELIQHLPGPESLRSIADGAALKSGVSNELIGEVNDRIDRFGALIRERFGTRGALNAAISDDNDELRKRYEESARYEVYNGMRHLLGVEAETWLTSMIFSPSHEDDELLEITTLHGALAMRRLRPDTPVRFTFGAPYPNGNSMPDPLESPIALQQFYANEPAPLQTEVRDGKLVHSLSPASHLGKNAIVDMLAVSHDPRGSRRYATPDRRLGGAALFHDVPVKTLHCDALVHESVFPKATPQLIVYNPGARGPANPNDPSRDIDRIEVREPVRVLHCDPTELEAPGVPNYPSMLGRVFETIGERPEAYRVFRVRIAYPVQGFQYVLAFEAPERK